MSNDSSTGGVLQPGGAPVLDDLDLDLIFQGVAAQITGLPGAYVRPRWQPKPPKRPPADVNWCAIGVMTGTPDDGPFIAHQNTAGVSDPSTDVLMRHEDLVVLASFYGPNAKQFAALLRDGLSVPQNTESLSANMIRFVPQRVALVGTSEIVNQQQIRRVDVRLAFRRKVQRTYAVQNLQGSALQVINDTEHVDFTSTATPP